MLRFCSLGSGSSGNAAVVEGGSALHATRLLVDCGLGIRQLEARLQRAGLQPDAIDAIFVTHEHSDHVGCAQQFSRRHRVPVWMSRGTHAAIGAIDFDGRLRLAQDGETIDLGDLRVHPFTVPHDAREPLQLRCTDGASSLGILTDLGHATAHVLQNLASCQALLLEFNHDAAMLANGAYPPFLKQRVGGLHGHLSNAQAADIARALNHPALGQVVAAHLSRKNNRPELARTTLADALGRLTSEVGVADPTFGTDWLTV